MPPVEFLDPSTIDCTRILHSRDEIYALLPQRHEFMLLDGIVHIDLEAGILAAFRDVKCDEWWCKAHLPGQPIFPGVLMLEAAAHLASFGRSLTYTDEADTFMGFGGVDNTKFRGAVVPPSRLIFVGKRIEARPRRFVFSVQGFVDKTMVFESRITGMPLRRT